MENSFEKLVIKEVEPWTDPDLPVLHILSVLGGLLFASAIFYFLDWANAGIFLIVQYVSLGIGLAVYLGRQINDIPFIYLDLVKGKQYQTLEDQKYKRFNWRKHTFRNIYIVLYATAAITLSPNIHFLVTLGLLVSASILPILYRIVAHRSVDALTEKRKKEPIKRVSSNGEVDLTEVEFIYENLETHSILSEKVTKKYKDIQAIYDYVTLNISFVDDYEKVYLLKRIGEEELPRLLKGFEHLETDLQKQYEDKTIHYLNKLEDEMNQIKEVINNKKAFDINTTFSLLEERYK